MASTRHRSACVLAFIFVVGASAFLGSQQDSPAPASAGPRFDGAYSFTVPLGPGLDFRGLAVVHADGTSTFSDVSDFGGPGGPIGPTLNSPAYGAWTRTGPRAIRVVWIRFLHDRTSGIVTHVLRATAHATFDHGNPDVVTGRFTEEVYPCAGPLACPEPASLPVQDPPQAELPFSAVRIRP